jgi:hypothetical protein
MIIQEVIEGPNCLTLNVTGGLPRKESLPKLQGPEKSLDDFFHVLTSAQFG